MTDVEGYGDRTHLHDCGLDHEHWLAQLRQPLLNLQWAQQMM
jgi:hypothetical protein